MARENDASAGNRLQNNTDLGINAYPVSMSAWFYQNVSNAYVITWLGDSTVDGDYMMMLTNPIVNTLSARSSVEGVGPEEAVTTNSFSVNAWSHGYVEWASATSRRAILNGDLGGAGTDTESAAFPVTNRFAVGELASASPNTPINGRIGEVAIWTVALADDEVVALAGGMSPLRVQAANLAGYWSLFGIGAAGEPDYSFNGNNLSEVGTMTVADHAPVGPPLAYDLVQPPFGPPSVNDLRGRRIGGGVGHGA